MKSLVRSLVLFTLKVFFYPLFIFVQTWFTKHSFLKKAGLMLVTIFILTPFWLLVWYLVFFSLRLGIYQLQMQIGVIGEPVAVSGTGSMYPTFPKTEANDIIKQSAIVIWPLMKRYPGGITLFGKKYFLQEINHFDIVSFENKKTHQITEEKYSQSSGFVKRVIGLPKDNITIRDGFVYLNGSLLKEPYTASPRSTFGGTFLKECQTITITEGQLFVLGDNRKLSDDSRFELGLIHYADIDHVLSFEEQDEYKKNWRDASSDDQMLGKVTLNFEKYYELLDQMRSKNNLTELRVEDKLEKSALLRIKNISGLDELSSFSKNANTSFKKAMEDSGYSNIIVGEISTVGYFDAQELIDHFLSFNKTKEYLQSNDYQDTGISAKIVKFNGCDTQVIVEHFGGYKPPDYTQEQINSWKKLVDNLNDIIPSWEKAKDYENINQQDLEKLLALLYKRLSNAQKILSKLANNQWLTKEEENMAELDSNLYKEAQDLIEKLNSK